MWLHVRDIPSAHTLIVSNKQKISLDVIEFAARLCVSFSKLKKGSYWVDYTLKNFVKVQQKAFVNYTNLKVLISQRIKMPVSPLGNINYINQNMAYPATQASNELAKEGFAATLNMAEFNEKKNFEQA